ncbi:MAG: glycosyltransferase [Desulfarculus sp.]|nr:glycosyltransferase [Desulfarculus sp.]
MPPLVSVLMSVHNGRDFLPAALDCILGQTLTDLEFIVIDDGSRDDTWELIQARAATDSRLRPARNPANLGLTRSLNRGLELARGRYLARQDVDDQSLPQRLAQQAAFLEAHPGVVLLGTWAERVDGAGRTIPGLGREPATDRAIRRKMLLANAFFHTSVMLRREILTNHGLAYDPELPFAQDYDLWSRLLLHGQGANLTQPLVRFRTHPGQISSARAVEQRRVADGVAWANLERAGLAAEFTPAQVALMRRLALETPPLTPGMRREQFAGLTRLIRLVEARDPAPDPEWERVKRQWLADARRYLFTAPHGREDLRARAAIIAADPRGALADAGAWLLRAIANRLPRRG